MHSSRNGSRPSGVVVAVAVAIAVAAAAGVSNTLCVQHSLVYIAVLKETLIYL